MNAATELRKRKWSFRELRKQKRISLVAKLIGALTLLVLLASFAINSMAAGDDDYIVKKGDTLSALAKKHHVTVKQLMDKNDLKNDRIYVGQHLIVTMLDSKGNLVEDGPGLQPGEVVYTIQKGDTLNSIARKYGVTVKSIMDYNHLESTNIIVGRWLTIQTKSAISPKPATPAPTPNVKTVNYVIQKGDNLKALAERFGISLTTLKQVNNMKNDTIYVGRNLKVPSANLRWTMGSITGAVDPNSIEIRSHYTPMVLEVSYGSSSSYKQVGPNGQLKIWYTKEHGSHRAALVSIEY